MRHLNDFEKKIIQAMLIREKPDDVCVVNLINKVLPIYVIAWSPDYETFSLAFKENEDFDTVRNKLFDLITLLRYLEEKQLIGIFPCQIAPGNMIYDHSKYEIDRYGEHIHTWFDVWEKIPHGRAHISGIKSHSEKNGIGKYIEKYVNSTFHVTQGLKDYVANGFRTDEEIRFQKEHQIAKWSLILATATSIISILLSIFK